MKVTVEWREADGGVEVVTRLSPAVVAEMQDYDQGWVALVLSGAAIRRMLVEQYHASAELIDELFAAEDMLGDEDVA